MFLLWVITYNSNKAVSLTLQNKPIKERTFNGSIPSRKDQMIESPPHTYRTYSPQPGRFSISAKHTRTVSHTCHKRMNENTGCAQRF